jgi:hypothetical protein
MRPGAARLRAVVKEQAARIPIFGRALLRTGNVRIERTDTAGTCSASGGDGRAPPDVSMLFYAEGTRSRDGAFHEFKKGHSSRDRLPASDPARGDRGDAPRMAATTLRLRSGPVVVQIGRRSRSHG